MIVEQFEDRLVQILLAVAVLSGVLSAFEDDPHVRRVMAVSCSLALAAALALACLGLVADNFPRLYGEALAALVVGTAFVVVVGILMLPAVFVAFIILLNPRADIDGSSA